MPTTRYFIQLFCYSWYLTHAYFFVQSCQSIVSCAGYQPGNPSATSFDALILTLPRPQKLIEVKKEEGVKRKFVPIGIPKLHIPSARPSSSSILELEAQLGRSQGKPGVLASLSPARVSYTTSSKIASTSGSARLAKSTLDKGKGVLKAPKVPTFKEREPPALSEEEEELRQSERRRAEAEAQLKHVEVVMVHLVTEKRKVEKS
ncbi:hypothetical protein Q3G72_022474 [Acer saccharum]|nr:hypothetical protein Q3G72_022474 [Acer saccharum]